MDSKIDEIDRQILAQVQVNARRSMEDLGELVGLSPSATHRRLQILRDRGVIRAEVAVIDPKALGRALVLVVHLTIDRDGYTHLENLRNWIVAEPAIQQCWYTTGDSDFVLIVTARDMEDYDEFIQRLVSDNPNVRRFITSVALSTTKSGMILPTGE